MENKYEYLFPFEKIPQGAKILIYGAGDVGQEYLQQMMMTGYCEVVGFIDRNWDKYARMIVPIYPVEKITEITYDFIVIAMRTKINVKSIQLLLKDFGVNLSNVIYQPNREITGLVFDGLRTNDRRNIDFAYMSTSFAVALKYGPGLGDCIQRKPLFKELMRLLPGCSVDIYTPNDVAVKAVYSDQPNIKNIIADAGPLYIEKSSHYMLAISIGFMLKIDCYNDKQAEKMGVDIARQLRILTETCTKYDLSSYPLTKSRVHLEREMYRGGNCYSLYNYTKVIQVKDWKVYIPLQETILLRFEKLSLEEYITIHTGSSLANKAYANIDARQWSHEYYQDFVNHFKEKYPKITIVQIGDKNTKKLQNVDRYIFDESLELVKYVLKNAIFHLSTEGGLMHLATQLGTKCITIFGPTLVQIYGYKQNINIVSNKCSGCFALYDDLLRCARGLEKPECMYDIRAEFVMERVEEFMKNHL